jgi:hypothetical protein
MTIVITAQEGSVLFTIPTYIWVTPSWIENWSSAIAEIASTALSILKSAIISSVVTVELLSCALSLESQLIKNVKAKITLSKDLILK